MNSNYYTYKNMNKKELQTTLQINLLSYCYIIIKDLL